MTFSSVLPTNTVKYTWKVHFTPGVFCDQNGSQNSGNMNWNILPNETKSAIIPCTVQYTHAQISIENLDRASLVFWRHIPCTVHICTKNTHNCSRFTYMQTSHIAGHLHTFQVHIKVTYNSPGSHKDDIIAEVHNRSHIARKEGAQQVAYST